MSGKKGMKTLYTRIQKQVVEAVIQEGLSYQEAARIYEVQGHDRIQSWEQIYLEEGPEGLAVERRGRRNTGRQKKLPGKAEEDLLAEVQRLREVPACEVVLTLPPGADVELTVEDTEPGNVTHIEGEELNIRHLRRDERRDVHYTYALLANLQIDVKS